LEDIYRKSSCRSVVLGANLAVVVDGVVLWVFGGGSACWWGFGGGFLGGFGELGRVVWEGLRYERWERGEGRWKLGEVVAEGMVWKEWLCGWQRVWKGGGREVCGVKWKYA